MRPENTALQTTKGCTHLKCCTFDWSSFFLRIILASTNGLGSGEDERYMIEVDRGRGKGGRGGGKEADQWWMPQ